MVNHLAIWGSHSSTRYVLVYRIQYGSVLGTISLPMFCPLYSDRRKKSVYVIRYSRKSLVLFLLSAIENWIKRGLPGNQVQLMKLVAPFPN